MMIAYLTTIFLTATIATVITMTVATTDIMTVVAITMKMNVTAKILKSHQRQ